MEIELQHNRQLYMSGPDYLSIMTLLVIMEENAYKIWRRKNFRNKQALWFMDMIHGSQIPEYAIVRNWYTDEPEWLEFLHLKDAVEYIRSENERRPNG